MLDKEPDLIRHDHTDERREPEQRGSPHRPTSCPTTRHHDAGDRHAFGELVQKDRDENHEAELGANQERAGNRHTVEESVEEQADQCRRAGNSADRVRFFAEVEMRRQGVLREVNSEITGENQQRCDTTAARERLW